MVGTLWSTTASVFSRRANLAVGHAEAFERLRAGHFMDQVAIDIEETGAIVLLVDDVVVPDLVIEGAGCSR